MTEIKVEEARQKGDIEDLGARLQGLSLHNFNSVGFKLPKPFEISYEQDKAVVNYTSSSATVFILPLSFEANTLLLNRPVYRQTNSEIPKYAQS